MEATARPCQGLPCTGAAGPWRAGCGSACRIPMAAWEVIRARVGIQSLHNQGRPVNTGATR
eukprot:999983-Alexandrium_andersonii.AAC.1